MSDDNRNDAEQYGSDEDLIGVLTAISVTSKHLARELVNATYAEKTAEGDHNEQHHKYGRSHKNTEKRSRRH